MLDKIDEISEYQRAKIKQLSTTVDSSSNPDDKAEKMASNEQKTVEQDAVLLVVDDEAVVKEKEEKKKLTEKFVNEINKINEELAKRLQKQDQAFSYERSADDDMVLIKFGMINETDAMKKLASNVQECGHEIEESTKFIESMSELIVQGIEKAKEDLRRENEQKMIEQVNNFDSIF